MSRVALIRCEEYDYEKVLQSVRKGLDLLGGPGKFARSGEKILLKPNLLSADPPERAATTNNLVVKAVAQIFQETGCILSYGDSPGFHSPSTASKKSKIGEAMEELGIPLGDFLQGREVFHENALIAKKITLANAVLDCDGLISLPKLKTHGFTRFTGAVKNQFGCVPGKLKAAFHVTLPQADLFCKMLVDINTYIKPRLYIIDGITAMEGAGPRGGNPKDLGVLLLSTDPVALDSTACRLIRLSPNFVPTNVYGKEAGLGENDPDKIELVGDNFDALKPAQFNVVNEPVDKMGKMLGLAKFLKKYMLQKPVIQAEKCIRCGVCLDVCPVSPKALSHLGKAEGRIPVYDYSKCIRCFCCQELCPESAIKIKSPPLRKIFLRKKV